jgi:hypothetical protein
MGQGIEPTARSSRLNRKLTLMLLLVPYLAVELAFNHRLLTLTSGTLDNDALRGVEIWGRIISGVGLGLLLWTFVIGKFLPRLHALPALALSLGLGILCMWFVQKSIVDYWVGQAPLKDKHLSLALAALAQPASLGQLRTPNGPVMKRPPDTALQLTVASLFPASALHAQRRDTLVLGWASQMGGSYTADDLARIPPDLSDNAYRNLIVPPLALGLSLLFALLNMAQLAFALVRYGALLMGHDLSRYALAQPLLALALVGASALSCNAFVNSEGYRQDLRPGLWREDPMLALLTEWGLHAVPPWLGVTEWAHDVMLMKATFRLPWPLAY